MRIAKIIEEGKLGGPQVRMVRVAAALKGRAETLIFMPYENSGPFRALCAESGVPYLALPLTHITKEWTVALRYLFFFVFEVLRLRRELKRRKFDLVHVSGGSWQYKGLIAAKLAGLPVVWHLNDTSMPRLIRCIFRALAPYADGFIFTSQRTLEYYGVCLGRDRPQYVIPPPIDPVHFDPCQQYDGDEDLIAS